MWDSEWAAFAFFVSMIAITFVFELGVGLMLAFPGVTFVELLLHWIFGLFLLHNVAGSLWKLICIDSSIRGVVLPNMTFSSTNRSSAPASRYCGVCECVAPPRSYHCSQCRVCVLKRTHHCLFARRCVGYKNFRYFYTLLIHVCIGCLYSSCINMHIVWPMLGGFTCRNFFGNYEFFNEIVCENLLTNHNGYKNSAHTFPFMFWMFGALSTGSMLICMLSVVHLCGFAFTLGLLAYHGTLMIRNQTVFERSRGVYHYDLFNTIGNIRESLGDRWYIVWLSPFVSSRLPRNGLQFPTSAEYRLQSRKTK